MSGDSSRRWSREHIAWVSGLVEGEGSITYRRHLSYILQVGMSDVDVLRRAQRILQVGRINGPYRAHRGNLPMWHWRLTEAETYAVLAAMWPWLGERRQAKARDAMIHYALRLRSLSPQRRQDLLSDYRRGMTPRGLASKYRITLRCAREIVTSARAAGADLPAPPPRRWASDGKFLADD